MTYSHENDMTSASEADAKARAQQLFDEAVSLFTSIASRAIRIGGKHDHPLVRAAEVEMNRVQSIAARLGDETVPMSQFVSLVTQINEATERLTQDMA